MSHISEYYQKELTVGEDCVVSPYTQLENVTLGSGVTIGDYVQLKNVSIGDNTKVGVMTRLYTGDPENTIKIGANCWLSYGVFGEATGGSISIGDCATLAHRVTMLTSSGPGEKNARMSEFYPEEKGSIHIGNNSWIGAAALLLPGSALEEGVVIGAQSMTRSGMYERWSVYAGSPARKVKKLDAHI